MPTSKSKPPVVEEGEPDVVDEYRLADGIEFVRTDGGIALVNVRAGRVEEIPYEAVDLLQQLLGWTTMADALHTAEDGVVTTGDAKGEAAGRSGRDAQSGKETGKETGKESGKDEDVTHGGIDLAVTIDVLDRLARLGALASRRDDLSGSRLDAPGPGWAAAQAYLRATHTTMSTQFVNSFEIADDLAAKAAVCRQPSAFYERVDAPFIPLAPPTTGGRRPKSGFRDVLLRRRTARRFAPEPVSAEDFSNLLYLTWGATELVENPLGDHFLRKSSPSGGALHTIEVYPIVLGVEGIEPGAYHYSVRRHGLELISDDDPATWIAAACGDQEWIAEAGVVFVCTSFLPRMSWKYDYSRAFRAVMAESGFTSQTAFLVAAWLGLGCFTTLALRDELLERVLDLDPEREPVLLVTGVGALEADLDDHSRPRVESESPPPM